ncbi:MAG: hypothetical protein H6813_00895 [Phycisphaeraceae bacterium]|nr:hypothetical protein [Phycisphaeraceae bacterium]MCB9847357.1 hypothetical protein [Phycisphaeraceae bacterium]
MNWVVFALAAWITMGIELGLRPSIQLGDSGMAPSFALVLVTYIALTAPRATALWAAMCVGVALDLTSERLAANNIETLTIVGPTALGCMLGASAVGNLRAMVYRRSPLTMLVLAALLSVIVQIVVVACLAARSWWDPALVFHARPELASRLGSAAYTGAIALVVGPALNFLTPLFGFHGLHQPRSGSAARW